jgi:hypothetical protein
VASSSASSPHRLARHGWIIGVRTVAPGPACDSPPAEESVTGDEHQLAVHRAYWRDLDYLQSLVDAT